MSEDATKADQSDNHEAVGCSDPMSGMTPLEKFVATSSWLSYPTAVGCSDPLCGMTPLEKFEARERWRRQQLYGGGVSNLESVNTSNGSEEMADTREVSGVEERMGPAPHWRQPQDLQNQDKRVEEREAPEPSSPTEGKRPTPFWSKQKRSTSYPFAWRVLSAAAPRAHCALAKKLNQGDNH